MAILPGNTLGMLGGGQLGRMFVAAASSMGYEVIVLDPDPQSPAGAIASEHLESAYDDRQALDYMAERCAVITTEFENIPADTLAYLAQSVAVHPSADALQVAQHRLREKEFFRAQGLDTAAFAAIENYADIEAASDFPFPAILKTSTLGYDGKGQVVCQDHAALAEAFEQLGGRPCVLEQRIDLACEVSVVLARSEGGEVTCFPIAENRHANGILDVTLVPASIEDSLAQTALDAATRIANGLGYIGVLAVEFFVSRDGRVLVNEMAPRPHNSGHYTLDACVSSQFEQQLRMVCGLAAGSCELLKPVAMLNLLGDVWPDGGVPPWDEVVGQRNAMLHLYGKKEARVGRKMGHVNCLGDSRDEAESLLIKVRQLLQPA
jgi:5-(carboxyamino)imidazole ribonucleotide synthase